MPIETRSRTGRKPPPKARFDDEVQVLKPPKQPKAKAVTKVSEPEQPVAKKAKPGPSKRERVKKKPEESSESVSTVSSKSDKTDKSKPLEVLTEDEEVVEISPQKNSLKDVTQYRRQYTQLGELFQTLFTPDPDLAAAYLKTEIDTNREIKKLKDIKNRTKDKPETAISHTPMGKKLIKLKGRQSKEAGQTKALPEPIQEEHDSSFESVASSVASGNFVKTPMRTPRVLRSRRVRKSLVVPKSPWAKDKVLRPKGKKVKGSKKGKQKQIEENSDKKEDEQSVTSSKSGKSVVIITPPPSPPLFPKSPSISLEVEAKKEKKAKVGREKRKFEDPEKKKDVFKIPNDLNFNQQHKIAEPANKKRILGDPNQDLPPQNAQTQFKSKKEITNENEKIDNISSKTLPAREVQLEVTVNTTTLSLPDQINTTQKTTKTKIASEKMKPVKSSGLKSSKNIVSAKNANLNPVVLIEKLPEQQVILEKTCMARISTEAVCKQAQQEEQPEVHSQSIEKSPAVEEASTVETAEPHPAKKSTGIKKSSLSEVRISSSISNEKPIEKTKSQITSTVLGKSDERMSGNTTTRSTSGKDELTTLTTMNSTYMMPSTEGNTTIYVDTPNGSSTFLEPSPLLNLNKTVVLNTKPVPPPVSFAAANATFVVTAKGDNLKPEVAAKQPTSVFKGCDSTFVVSKDVESPAEPPNPSTFSANQTYVAAKNETFALPTTASSNVDINVPKKNVSNESTKALVKPAVPEKPKLMPQGSVGNSKVVKKSSSSGSLCSVGSSTSSATSKTGTGSGASSSSSSSKAESVIAGTSRSTPKGKLIKTLSSSREKLHVEGSNSKTTAMATLEKKKQEELQRLEERTMEGVKKKEMYLQQKKEMQRKKNEEWKAKMERKKANELLEKIEKAKLEKIERDRLEKLEKDKLEKLEKAKLEKLEKTNREKLEKGKREAQAVEANSCNQGIVAKAVQTIYKMFPANRALHNPLIKGTAPLTGSCPDIHAGSLSKGSSTSTGSMTNLLKKNPVGPKNPPIGKAPVLGEKSKVSPASPGRVLPLSVPHEIKPDPFVVPTSPKTKPPSKPVVVDISFDVTHDESFCTAANTTLDETGPLFGTPANTTFDETGPLSSYEITCIEVLEENENMEHRAKKHIPEWARDSYRLHRSLFMQQPALLGIIRTPIFPQKNIGYKLFPNIPH